jgi:hypothetical protein
MVTLPRSQIPHLLGPHSHSVYNIHLTLYSLVVVSCILSPYLLAFGRDSKSDVTFILDQAMNGFFMVDIVLNFFTAFYDEDMGIIDNHHVSIFTHKFPARKLLKNT